MIDLGFRSRSIALDNKRKINELDHPRRILDIHQDSTLCMIVSRCSSFPVFVTQKVLSCIMDLEVVLDRLFILQMLRV